MRLLAIDPGTAASGYVEMDGTTLLRFGKIPNTAMVDLIQQDTDCSHCVIEQIRSYGLVVGQEVLDTCVWSGRFYQAFVWREGRSVHWLPRKDVKLNLCGNPRAKDSNIRQAIIDRFGGKEKAIGRKAAPGPLYGISADIWQALAVALTFLDKQKAGAI